MWAKLVFGLARPRPGRAFGRTDFQTDFRPGVRPGVRPDVRPDTRGCMDVRPPDVWPDVRPNGLARPTLGLARPNNSCRQQ